MGRGNQSQVTNRRTLESLNFLRRKGSTLQLVVPWFIRMPGVGVGGA